MAFKDSKHICSSCKGSVWTEPSSLKNTSTCCDARIVLRPNLFEERRFIKAKKDLLTYEKNLAGGRISHDTLPGERPDSSMRRKCSS